MAVTAIWDIKGWLGDVVIYIQNPEKTENPDFYKAEVTDSELQGLTDVIQYALDQAKTTEDKEMPNESIQLRQFVSGVNCYPGTARSEMLAVKKRFCKENGITAYHGYQSFAEGEVTPEQAHEIGVKLAEKLWGDRFQVLVATHLDKTSHIHNHFVLNSVSFLDGKKYNDCLESYRKMRETSDSLCREYGLSVIENPKRGKSKQYGEWRAEQEQRPTWRGIVKADIDEVISRSVTDKQFYYLLRQKGYDLKFGKDISVRPPGKERFFRLARNLGEEYTEQAIYKRILQRHELKKSPEREKAKNVKYLLRGNYKTAKRISGLRGLYLCYCFRLGVFPKNKKRISTARLHFLLKEDLCRLEKFTQETRLLCVNRIETHEQLFSYKEKLEDEIHSLNGKRKSLRNDLRRISGENEKSGIKSEISDISKRLSELREEVNRCEDIEWRSLDIKDKLNKISLERKEKEEIHYDKRGRSGRSDR